MIYFDNNATTSMDGPTVAAMLRWINKGNPSASYKSAEECRALMDQFRAELATPPYYVVFCSGASEANAMAVESVLSATPSPHIVCSSVEHKSILAHLRHAEQQGRCQLTIVPAQPSGHITVESVRLALRGDTAAVFVMAANNETGAINDIEGMVAALPPEIYFHVDCVQSYGKFGLPPGVTSASISFHKLGGPPGVGALIALPGRVTPLIHGSQMNGLRGGTENMPGIAGAMAATAANFVDRAAKNARLAALKRAFVAGLRAKLPVITYAQYRSYRATRPVFECVLISGDAGYLPNTLLISLVLYYGERICNSSTKKLLEQNKIIVSVGSACNTASPYASHVLDAIGADQLIKSGALRISFGDQNTMAEVERAVAVFYGVLSPVVQRAYSAFNKGSKTARTALSPPPL
jgi:cysteine desulfurase